MKRNVYKKNKVHPAPYYQSEPESQPQRGSDSMVYNSSQYISYKDLNANVELPLVNTFSKFTPKLIKTRTVSTQYIKSDFCTNECKLELKSSEHSASTISSSEKGTNRREQIKLLKNEAKRIGRIEFFFNPSSNLNLVSESNDSLGTWADDDYEVVTTTCESEVSLPDEGSQILSSSASNISFRHFGCQTDWWVGMEIEVAPTGLTFNATSAYNICDKIPTKELNNNSRYTGMDVVKLRHIHDTLDSENLVRYLRWYLVVLALLLIFNHRPVIQASGISMFIAVLYIKFRTKYLQDHLLQRFWTFCFVALGTFPPILTGIYCLHVIHHLHMLRPYYLRTTMYLIVPLSLFIITVSVYAQVQGTVQIEFEHWMKAYHSDRFAQTTWDSTQFEFQCCGLYGPNDWKELNFKYPISCCRKVNTSGNDVTCHTEVGSDYWSDGCLENILKINFQAILPIIIVAVVQFTIEAMSACLMRSFYKKIKHKLLHKPSILKILFGPLASLCESAQIYSKDPRRIIPFPLMDETSSETESETTA